MNFTPDQVTDRIRSLIQRRAQGDDDAQVDIVMGLCTRPSETFSLMLTLAHIAAAPIRHVNERTGAVAVLQVDEDLPRDHPTVLAGGLLILVANDHPEAAFALGNDITNRGLTTALPVISALLDILVQQAADAVDTRPFPPQNPELN